MAGTQDLSLGEKTQHDPSAFSSSDKAAEAGRVSYEVGSPTTSVGRVGPLTPPEGTTESKIVRKIDAHIIPFIIVLYLLAFLDRVNIGNARAFGLEEDLGLEKVEYNTALTIFFVPYIILEIPGNILMKKFSPRVWLSVCCIGFGLVSVFQGLVQNYGGLLATRFFLGVFECSMFPGCFFLLASWYKRADAQKRYSLFFSSTSLAGAFGGLLASAIGKMDYIQGYRGWRWIFIVEGCVTVVAGLIFFFTFPAFPEQARFLKPAEREYVTAMLQADHGHSAAERKITLKDVGKALTDHRIWLGGFMYLGLIVPAYSYAYFSPTIIKTYGYDSIQTQLHSVPPWAAAFGFAMLTAVLSDWLRHRLMFAILGIAVAIIGFAMLMTIHDPSKLNAQYAALFLVAMGAYSAMPIIVCWFNMNLGGHHRKAIGTAWQIAFGNIGGIIATYSFVASDEKNHYRNGYSICVAFTCLSALSCLLYAFSVVRENKKRAQMQGDGGLTEEEKADLGDLNPEFRYML
ncbi:major facilitator superfamily domain-containing protein [Sordaria brevicollis]|uniref:Major facilitator superfamily domain-containing protein n=1 Tax=Sordaria brevicollis TaxID=83679 RepID=A0AAE0U5M2_SORBR|nr:major facilitator superfamily domain-containing protein [Sordaria brevicollis]